MLSATARGGAVVGRNDVWNAGVRRNAGGGERSKQVMEEPA